MVSLTTEYMGLKLKNPIILGSSPLTRSKENLKKAEKVGVGAVVLGSIFEEQILSDAGKNTEEASEYFTHSEAFGFLSQASRDYYIDRYMTLIEEAKKILSVPVIASVCCSGDDSWIDYAKRFESCGADGIELNYYPVAGNSEVPGEEIEKKYISLAKIVKKKIKLPVSLKIGNSFSSVSNMVKSFDDLKIDGLVMFNSFLQPDIDIDKLKITNSWKNGKLNNYGNTLRWVAMMSAEVKTSICASTGINDADTAIKMLLAGAKGVQVCSTVLKNGFDVITEMILGLSKWMEKKGYSSIDEFRGKLAQEKIENPEVWERAQFMKFSNSFDI